MHHLIRRALGPLAALLCLALAPSAFAACAHHPVGNTSGTDSAGELVVLTDICDAGVGGGGGGSASPFASTGHTTLSVTTSTARVAFPSADTTIVIGNTGTNRLHFKLGSVSVTAATTDVYLAPGMFAQYAANSAVDIAAITDTGTTTLDVQSGTGSVFASGGGGCILDTSGNCADPAATGNVNVLTMPTVSVTQGSPPWVMTMAKDTDYIAMGNNSGVAYSPAASGTDIFTLTGSATKTVAVVGVWYSCLATAASPQEVYLAKRSTADTSGTSSAPAKVPTDSGNTAATATVLAYTVNPTPGSLVGNVGGGKVTCANGTTPVSGGGFGQAANLLAGGQPILLKGTSEVLAINLGGTTASGESGIPVVEWREY